MMGATGLDSSSASSHHSLRKRLLGLVLVAILFVALLQAATAYRSALQQADVMFDDHLEQVARSLGGRMRLGEPGSDALPGYPSTGSDDDSDSEIYVQVWGPDGTQIFRSTLSALPQRTVLGFSEVESAGRRYRVYSLQTPPQTVQIAQDLSARSARAKTLALRAVFPFALLTPLLMLAVWWIINRSLAPIERARRQVASRTADDFHPLACEDLPDEVRPLVDELNLLFGRVRGAFELQKNFVTDAAHELRSPLTALKLHAQALQLDPTNTEKHKAGVERLNEGIDRAIRLVEQLMALARAESGSDRQFRHEPVDLNAIVRRAVADMLPRARLKHIDLGSTSSSAAQVQGQPDDLQTLLRNLLDNAIKYTPVSGQVDVGIEFDGESAVLVVDDSGPGIDPESRPRVFDRFYRASQAAAETGSGLGLAIVKAIADQHGAALSIGTSARLGGLRIETRFAAEPPVKPPSA